MVQFKMRFIALVGLLPWYVAAPLSAKTTENDEKLPNIIFVFADDMGYGDVSALNPAARTQTPAIDELAGEGIIFTEAHASGSVCTPSRYGLLTGRYAFRSEHAARGIGGFHKSVIESGRATLASVLKGAGYTTACIGKWHLGVDWQTRDGSGEPALNSQTGRSNVDYTQKVTKGPNDYGFDYSFIHTASLDIPPYMFLRNHEVIDPEVILTTDHYPLRKEDTEYAWDRKHTNDQDVYWQKGVWWRKGEMSRSFRIEDCHTEIVEEGVAFVDKQASENPEDPFFLYLPLTGPHTPWMPTEQFKGESDVGLYGDFILNVDHAVKQIQEALISNGIEENTMLIFSSDNGAYWPQEEVELYAHDSNQGRKGQKGDVWDGGHRIPLVISWPAKIEQPSEYPHMVSLTDFFATFCDLIGEEPPKDMGEDSFSFWQVLNGESGAPIRQSMVHHSAADFYSIRSEDWKYIEGLGSGGFSHPTQLSPEQNSPKGQLYNLKEDPLESQNLFFKHPEKVSELSSLLHEIVESKNSQQKN